MTNKKIHLSRTLSWILLTIVMSGFIFYVIFQARFLLTGPQVSLTTEPTIVQNQRIITLVGKAANITEITLNGRAIATNETGYFAETVILENGYTVVRIAARDRYGRETVLERPLVYVPKSFIP